MNPISWLVDGLMMPFLAFSYEHIVPNFGVGIILLTLLIKLVFFPLTQKQFKSMKTTQKIQPQMKKIQEKYKGEPQKMQQEMMKLWKENNANPFGGCIPALVQIPFFFAIFYTIRSEAFTQLIHAKDAFPGLFTFWLKDLSLKDGTYILPLLLGISMYWSQKMMMTDPKQAKIMAFMPIMMFFISINMPAGVLLYWATSQLLSSAHQYWVMKQPEPTDIKARPVAG